MPLLTCLVSIPSGKIGQHLLLCIYGDWNKFSFLAKKVGFFYLDYLLGNKFVVILLDKEIIVNAVEKGDAGAMNNLAWIYFEMEKNKEKALKLAEAAYTSEKDIYNAHTLSTTLLWNNEIQRAIEISNNFLETEDALEKFPDYEGSGAFRSTRHIEKNLCSQCIPDYSSL